MENWMKENGWTDELAKEVLNNHRELEEKKKKRAEKKYGDKSKEEIYKLLAEDYMKTPEKINALIELIAKYGRWFFFRDSFDEYGMEGMQIEINCNDWFIFACADSQPITWDGILELKEMADEDPDYGILKWCCKQRGFKPEPYEQEKLRKEGKWEDWMSSLEGIDSYSPSPSI